MSTEKENPLRTYAIREVVQLLAEEFEISESNLRFWEKEGLLNPKRTKGGHRTYTDEDIATIRLVYKLKNERYFPLPIIKQLVSCGMPASMIEQHVEMASAKFFRPLSYDPDFRPCTLPELAVRTGMDFSLVERMAEVGLLSQREGAAYDEDDLRIVELLEPVFEIGLAPEDFRRYLAAVEALVREEIALVRCRPEIPKEKARDPRLAAIAEELPRYLYRKTQLKVFDELKDQGFFEEKMKRFHECYQKGTE